MKTALTIGCGSTNGAMIVNTLVDYGYAVTNIGSSPHEQATNIQIQWNDLEINNLHKLCNFEKNIDFIFFNHNASSLNENNFNNLDTLEAWKLVKDWQRSHWIACQMPFLLLHTLKDKLTSDTKIGWMLSTTMFCDNPNAVTYPDYSSQKYFNYLSMQCFGKHYQTFGIMPDFNLSDSRNQLKDIIIEVCNTPQKNKIFHFK